MPFKLPVQHPLLLIPHEIMYWPCQNCCWRDTKVVIAFAVALALVDTAVIHVEDHMTSDHRHFLQISARVISCFVSHHSH